MAFCWEMRGCDEEMQSRCPHNSPGEPCPADCHYTACKRETHAVESNIEVLLNPDLNYEAAIKQVCKFCSFFLTNGPAFTGEAIETVRPGSPNRFLL